MDKEKRNKFIAMLGTGILVFIWFFICGVVGININDILIVKIIFGFIIGTTISCVLMLILFAVLVVIIYIYEAIIDMLDN